MDFSNLIDRDITLHTQGHKYRGILLEILTATNNVHGVLALKMGVDDFYIATQEIVAVTVHGREFGKENVEDGTE